MPYMVSSERLRFIINRFRERLWVRPLVVCLLSAGAAVVAKLADGSRLAEFTPQINAESVESLLSIMAASMLVIATFSVTSMVSAYASASSTATPRSFALIVADDASQNALSTFVGAFIFSIVALTAVKNDYFESAGLFILFSLTALVFGAVILTFIRWVDSIARLGRMKSTINKVEQATESAMRRRRLAPTLGGVAVSGDQSGETLLSDRVGYVQHIDLSELQRLAEQCQCRVVVASLPGTFSSADRPLAYVVADDGRVPSIEDMALMIAAFQIGRDRLFDDDPRFGLVVLSEIACRALSPAVNDPGTAIDILATLLRLFSYWCKPADAEQPESQYDRIEVAELSVRDMFDDAFTSIARDGAGMVEVTTRLQKVLHALATSGGAELREAAIYHSRLSLQRARLAMALDADLAVVREAARFSDGEGQAG